MSSERLKGYSSFKRVEDSAAERQLLGREVEDTLGSHVRETSLPAAEVADSKSPNFTGSSQLPASYQAASSGLNPRPRTAAPEPTTQMSFRIPLSLAKQFRKKARYNQLEQQEIIAEVLKRALAELPDAPPDWDD